MIVQIYEIQTPSEAEEMIALGVDCVGSVLLPEMGLRQPILQETVRAVQRSGRKSSLIPLTRNLEDVFESVEYYRPDVVHFCENLAASRDAAELALARQRAVRERFPEIRIMRSVPIAPDGMEAAVASLSLAALFEPVSDLLLTDTLHIDPGGGSTAAQPVEGFVGITGMACHWGTAAQLVSQSRLPVILAGGLSPDNVKAAVEAVRPAGVDSCTLTNAVDAGGKPVRFRKDEEKVRRFVRQARSAGSTATGS